MQFWAKCLLNEITSRQERSFLHSKILSEQRFKLDALFHWFLRELLADPSKAEKFTEYLHWDFEFFLLLKKNRDLIFFSQLVPHLIFQSIEPQSLLTSQAIIWNLRQEFPQSFWKSLTQRQSLIAICSIAKSLGKERFELEAKFLNHCQVKHGTQYIRAKVLDYKKERQISMSDPPTCLDHFFANFFAVLSHHSAFEQCGVIQILDNSESNAFWVQVCLDSMFSLLDSLLTEAQRSNGAHLMRTLKMGIFQLKFIQDHCKVPIMYWEFVWRAVLEQYTNSSYFNHASLAYLCMEKFMEDVWMINSDVTCLMHTLLIEEGRDQRQINPEMQNFIL